MIHSIQINKFRAFKDVGFRLGRYITAIAGQNATGKTTLLGMIGNSSELKKKDGLPILQNQFRTEWSEIFKASPTYDKKGSNLFEISFSSIKNPNQITYTVPFRATWQDKGTRFRLIPKRTIDKKKTEAKVPWPTLYLGLSRLFPIGEIKQEVKLRNLKLEEDDKQWVKDSYISILSYNDNVQDFRSIDASIKKGIGVQTSNYDYLVNSAGEDNIGQILLSILSFKKLKMQNPDYDGGLLLIDELEATLHPAVQLKLYKFLVSCARKYQLQIVFTTHSMTLLEYISTQCIENVLENVNNVELIYLSTANVKLTIDQNPSIQQIKYDLYNTSSIIVSPPKLLVYSEDKETRWFLSKLIPEYKDRLRLLEIKMGWKQLLDLREQDMNYFSSVLFVLDGDVSPQEIDYNNIITLPGEASPEEVFYNFLMDLTNNPEHELWNNSIAKNNGFNIRTFKEYGPEYYECKKARERSKAWFNENLSLFEQLRLYEYWASDNKDLVEEFRNNFICVFNELARINSIPKIEVL
jgi:AAA15 family ATPase/GTPase